MSQVHISLDLAEGTRVRITVEALPDSGDEAEAQATRTIFVSGPGSAEAGPDSVSLPVYPQSAMMIDETESPLNLEGHRPCDLFAWARLATHATTARLRSALGSWTHSLEASLFGFALLVYLSTRLVGLTQFPIYFFTDEAVQTVLAADLVRDNFKSYEKEFLPTYFKNGTQYNLSTSVYLQVIPYLLFDKSVFVTRATSVLVTLLAAVCVGLILRDIFNIPYWWAGTLILSITPAWFLHSRTAFETVLFVSLYTCVLYNYLLYRQRSPRYLYPTLILAALAFYSYSPGQLIIAATGLLLLISDARYHWENRRIILRGLVLAALLALPYLRFRFTHSTAFTEQLSNLHSYWVQPLPLKEKIARFASEYLTGLSPGYWFTPNEHDLVRHRLGEYGHLMRAALPFAAIGLILSLKKIRSPAYRSVLISLLAAPTGAALVRIGITRTLVFVIPAALLTALGLSYCMTWIENKKIHRKTLSVGLFTILAMVNFFILRDALVNGPTWFQNYGLGGMQYGAQQLFGTIKEHLKQSPETKIIVSPSWSNGTDVVARFFLPDPLPIQMGSIEGHLTQHLPLDDDTLFVLIPDEYQKAISSDKFTDIRLDRTLLYPNGQPGFYFARMRYVDNIDQILAAERQARHALITGQITLNGQNVQVKYPHLDMGNVIHAFDGDTATLIRTLEANPAVIELQFPEPVRINGLYLKFGSTEALVTVQLDPIDGPSPIEYSTLMEGSVEKPDGTIDFGEPVTTQRITLMIEDTRQPEPGHVHIWEIGLR